MSEVTFYQGQGNHSVRDLEKLMAEREEALYQKQLKIQDLEATVNALNATIKLERSEDHKLRQIDALVKGQTDLQNRLAEKDEDYDQLLKLSSKANKELREELTQAKQTIEELKKAFELECGSNLNLERQLEDSNLRAKTASHNACAFADLNVKYESELTQTKQKLKEAVDLICGLNIPADCNEDTHKGHMLDHKDCAEIHAFIEGMKKEETVVLKSIKSEPLCPACSNGISLCDCEELHVCICTIPVDVFNNVCGECLLPILKKEGKENER